MPVQNSVKEFVNHIFLPASSNNQRPKILHPAGLSIIVGIFLLNNALKCLVGIIPGYVLGFASSVTTEEIISLSNQERAKAGLPHLSQNPQLTNAAYAKAQDMFSQNYWAHVSPTGTQPWTFIRNAGYNYQSAGENLARDFADSNSLMAAWMASSSHKENILSSRYENIGVAVMDGTLEGIETRLVVQMFGSPAVISTPVAQANIQSKPVASVETLGQTPAVVEGPQLQLQEETIPQEAALQETDFGKNKSQETKPLYTGTNLAQTTFEAAKTKRIISPNQISQVFGMLLIVLILGTLLADWIIAHRRRSVRLVGKNWAHLTFLGIIILMLMQYAQGNIL